MALRKGSLLRIPTKDQSHDVPAPSESNLLDVMDTHTKKEKENTLFGGRCVWCLIKTYFRQFLSRPNAAIYIS